MCFEASLLTGELGRGMMFPRIQRKYKPRTNGTPHRTLRATYYGGTPQSEAYVRDARPSPIKNLSAIIRTPRVAGAFLLFPRA